MNNYGADATSVLNQIEEKSPNKAFLSYLDSYHSVLPEGSAFEQDTWNIIEWVKNRASTNVFNLSFKELKNNDFKTIVKIYVCNMRFSQLVEAKGCRLLGPQALRFLDQAIEMKPLFRINNKDFLKAEKLMLQALNRQTAYRYAGALHRFANWLSSKLGISVAYNTGIVSDYMHGRNATDAKRDEKLIPTECLLDVLSHINDQGLQFRDEFFLNMLTLSVATGFRINELLTLPANPIIKTPEFCLRYFAEKNGELGIKPIAPSLQPAVESAVNKLIAWTEDGRKLAMISSGKQSLDWKLVYENDDALEYYFRKYLHDVTSDINNRVINPNGAWYNKEARWIDMFNVKKEFGSFLAAQDSLGIPRNTLSKMHKEQELSSIGISPFTLNNSRGKLRTNFDTDIRFPSFMGFESITDRTLIKKKRIKLIPLLEAAIKIQSEGHIYTCPDVDEKIEKMFVSGDRALLVDHESRKIILRASESLFVTKRYELSESHNTKEDSYSIVTDKRFGDWLGGTTRGRGKGGWEDSIFARLNVIDPRTNKPLKITVHDVRHWLNTVLNEGGVSQEAIRLIFARKSQATNSTYDQTSALTRVNRLKDDIRKGNVFGEIQDCYNTMMSDFGRDKAEAYLNAKTAILTIMPHGGCTMSWNRPSCDNYMSCFAGDEPCNELCIDLDDKDQIASIIKSKSEQSAMLSIIPQGSPQHAHITKIILNMDKVLSGCNKGTCNG